LSFYCVAGVVAAFVAGRAVPASAATPSAEIRAAAALSVSPLPGHHRRVQREPLRVGGSLRWRALLRFDVRAPVPAASHVTLRLWARGGARRLTAWSVAGGRKWTERARKRSPGRKAGSVTRRRGLRSGWVEIDVSDVVRSAGRATFAITGDERSFVTVAGRKTRRRAPRLVLRSHAATSPTTAPPTGAPGAPGAPPAAPGPAAPGPTPSPSPAYGIPLPDDVAAARVTRSSFEPRPGNATANARRPTASELATYRTETKDWRRCNGYPDHVTGDFSGTTDEILQWAAAKWGLDAETVRAQAAVETWWRQDFVGNGGDAYGIMQIRRSGFPAAGLLPQQSTAFAADLYGSIIRSYFDGCATWLNDVEHGSHYAAGDLWGSIGAWYAGRWHTADAEWYIARVKQEQAARPWLDPYF
jgi:autotransporter family porin